MRKGFFLFFCSTFLFALLCIAPVPHVSAHGAVPTHPVTAQQVTVDAAKLQQHVLKGHTIPNSWPCFATGCDNLYFNSGSPWCSTWQTTYKSETLWVNGHALGTLIIFKSNSSNSGCFSAWTALHENSNYCVWNAGLAQGVYNTIDVNNAPMPNQSPVCGNWISSGMDEDELLVNHTSCESGWISGGTGWGNFSVKIIGGGSGC